MIVLKVFVNEEGDFGNPVGIVVDEGNHIAKEQRQIICTESGFSEVVFVNNSKDCNISIYSPTGEIPFAGHAAIGASWYLSKLNQKDVSFLRCQGQKVRVRHEGKLFWVEADMKTLPPWNLKKSENVRDLDELMLADTEDYEHVYLWAWLDEAEGVVRARTFAPDWLIPEDEANGSGSMLLAAKLKRNIKIFHGKGSVIHANYFGDDRVEVGGLVVQKAN